MGSHRNGDKEEAASGGVSSSDHLCYRRDPTPFPIMRYVKPYGDKLDDKRFNLALEG